MNIGDPLARVLTAIAVLALAITLRLRSLVRRRASRREWITFLLLWGIAAFVIFFYLARALQHPR